MQEKSKAESDLEARIAELNKQMSDQQKQDAEEKQRKAYNSLGKAQSDTYLYQ